MQTKSRIQVITEQLGVRDTFFSSIRNIMEQYEIRDNILCPDKSGFVLEAKKGYWEPIRDEDGKVVKYDSLDKAERMYENCSQGIRIQKTETGYQYTIGNIVESMQDIKEMEDSVDLDRGMVMVSAFSGAKEEHKD